MVLKWCAILAGCLLAEACIARAASDDLHESDARSLYEAASVAIRDGDVVRAIDLLEQVPAATDTIVDEFPASHAWLIQFYLAELYVHSGRYEASLQALSRAAKQPDHTRQLTTAGVERLDRWTRVAEHAIAHLSADPSAIHAVVTYLNLNEQQAKDVIREIPRWQLHTQRVTLTLAGRYESRLQLAEAVELYRQATELVPSVVDAPEPAVLLDQASQGQRGYLRSALKLAQASPTTARALDELEQLSERTWLATDERLSVELAICDCLLSRGEAAQALKELDTLESSHQVSPEREIAWSSTIAFKRAEALAQLGKRAEAMQVLESAIEASGGYALLHEMHYLAGRLAILDADFERARQHLADAATCGTSDPGAQGRAIWMMGETYFLQRSYQHAIACYSRLQHIAPESPWTWRGLFQTAKCYELTDNRQAAEVAYRAFSEMVAEHPDFEQELAFASERLTAITASTSVK